MFGQLKVYCTYYVPQGSSQKKIKEGGGLVLRSKDIWGFSDHIKGIVPQKVSIISVLIIHTHIKKTRLSRNLHTSTPHKENKYIYIQRNTFASTLLQHHILLLLSMGPCIHVKVMLINQGCLLNTGVF